MLVCESVNVSVSPMLVETDGFKDISVCMRYVFIM